MNKFWTYNNKFIFILKYVQNNKDAGNDWFRLESNKDGNRWFGKCWYMHELLKYEFDIEFEVRIDNRKITGKMNYFQI